MNMKKYKIGDTFDLQGYMRDLNIELKKRQKHNENKQRKEDRWN